MSTEHRLVYEPSPKRVRAIVGGVTVADSLRTVLVLESGHLPVYYFPTADMETGLMSASPHRTRCPYKGEAAYWSLRDGKGWRENAVWGYERPIAGAEAIRGLRAFYWDRVDHWLEEDEEIFGHPRDPYHRVDVRPSSRRVRVIAGGETVAETTSCLMLFETGMPTRYYIPPEDVRQSALTPSSRRSICPYKGNAVYWSLDLG